MNASNRPYARMPRANPARARAQRGIAAMEFALVFPLFFLILYAIVTYSLILVAQQNLTLAASEGARAALNWQSNSSMSDALSKRATAACNAANLVAVTLVQSMQCTTTTTACGPGNAMQCINVSLSFNYRAHPLVPTLPLLGLTVPNTLSGNATVQLNPENIQ
ncbi:TadE/TadG family type IV pilus assembly protein [Paraburkholderia antibiotica]|uniref:Pilus assembly protein n=1 Tax=Paraburkholderia antibiotica TaxID=2728839 RepID=A0A7X9X687_9BURK|nr:TadE/TadG family type IV pilus assembly protein [Paraburkholderia antibiotica]NML32264.1 pilus assembly protein [Paraburkholderia antibiotica]